MVVPPQFLAATVSEPDVGADECVLSVRWSEAVISCGGSVSQYVLSVTPPTPDCLSGQCVMTTDTQYNLTVTVDQTYSLTVTAFDRCGNNQAGENSMTSVELTGSYIYNVNHLYHFGLYSQTYHNCLLLVTLTLNFAKGR